MGFLGTYSEFGDEGQVVEVDLAGYDSQSDSMIGGTPNSPPVLSDAPQTSVGSWTDTLKSILGSIGTTARDIGTAVGTAEREIRGAPGQYRTAREAAAEGNALSQWWQYSTTQDKLVIGLAVAGIVVVLWQQTR